GAGRFASSATYGPLTASSIVAGDFNHDGHLDLAAPDVATDTVQILRGDGTGHFSAGSVPAGGHLPMILQTADLNRAGRPDLAVLNTSPVRIGILLGDGAGSFTAGTTLIGNATNGLAIADLDGDGALDLANSALITDGSTALFHGDG